MDWKNFSNEVMATKRGTGCAVCRLLSEVTPEEAVQIKIVLEDDRVSARAIHDAFRARNVSVGREKVTDHRKGKCL